MSALAGTIAAPFAARHDGLDAMRWLRSGLSLALALAILAVALPAAFGAGTRGVSAEPVQVFSSSPLLSPAASGAAQLSASGLVPGQSRSALIHVANRGPAAVFGLSSRVTGQSGGTALSNALLLRVEAAASGKTLFAGRLAQMPRLALGAFAAGSERAYRFSVTLPASAGNEVAGSSVSAAFAWAAS